MRKEAFLKYQVFVPASIIDFIILYGCYLDIKWTHTYSGCAEISEDARGVACHTHSFYCLSITSNTGWQQGKHVWSVQLMKGGGSIVIHSNH